MERTDCSKGTVLLVDDDSTNLGVLSNCLEVEGFEILVSQDGESACQQAETEQPDIILLDVVMPGIDGFETCRRLKEHAATTEIPVIFMTALAETAHTVTGFEVGGVDYITKPLRHAEVLARVKAHLTIRRQQQQLHALNASKDKFFSIVAHDLKNPFNGFLAFVDLLEENIHTWNKDRIIELTAMLRTSAEHLSALLDNLLTWSRVQRGMLEYHPEHCDLSMVAAQNIALFTPNAEQKQISISPLIQEQTIVLADVNMLDTVMRNLLSNALKFTHAGGTVEVSARHDLHGVEISVSDTGTGIAEEHIPKLFRIDAKNKHLGTAREKGTGLGLLLCQEFVKQHGGSIRVVSEVGKGSTFSFTLPKELIKD
ncbi:MAG: hybrid sensor histidine kinase/response regulator [bacterium]|nr:hybrid sensor histidine kinase/response regulator [bacterium]